MKKDIFRNIAIVTAIFMITLSTMLLVNYLEVRNVTPLQSEIASTLKTLNESGAASSSPDLAEQIRELDLLARKAYFVREGHLKAGVYILLAMAGILTLCLRFYFEGTRTLPEEDIAPLDEWLLHSKSRSYVLGLVGALAVVAIVLGFLSGKYYSPGKAVDGVPDTSLISDLPPTGGTVGGKYDEDPEDAPDTLEDGDVDNEEVKDKNEEEGGAKEENASSDSKEAGGEESGEKEEVSYSKVTSNAFRGNTSNGQSSARGIPTAWDLQSGKNILWKIPTPKPGFNSPLINGRRVFFTGADDSERVLYCVDINTGEELWHLSATDIPLSPSVMPAVNPDTGLAASSAATNGKAVAAAFATGDIICADMEGNRLWARNLGVPDNHYGFASSLLTYGDLLFVQYDNDSSPKVMALSMTNGATVWTKERRELATWSSPTLATVGGKAQLLVMGNPHVCALDPLTGETLWSVDCMSGEVGASPCISSSGTVFAASENAKMVAIDPSSGEVLWEGNDYLPEIASPAATKDLVYIATSYGCIAAYSTSTGELIKDHDLGGQFYASPVIVEGKVYMANTDGKVYIFSAGEGFPLIGSIDTGEATFATPAFTDGKIVIRSNDHIYCVSAAQ